MKKLNNTLLAINELEAIEESILYLRNRHQVFCVILFGSKARGDYDEHSDIDLLIVTLKKLNNREETNILNNLFDIGIKYNVIFSPLNVALSEWNNGIFTEFYIYNEIMKDGILCYESTSNH